MAVAAVVGMDDDAEAGVEAEFEVFSSCLESTKEFASRRLRASRRERVGVAALETGMETGTTALTSSSSSSDDNRLTMLFMKTTRVELRIKNYCNMY